MISFATFEKERSVRKVIAKKKTTKVWKSPARKYRRTRRERMTKGKEKPGKTDGERRRFCIIAKA
jgi:hypothetical protein